MEANIIHPIKCSKAFGNPSGHSSSAAMISIVLILDVFHGRAHNLRNGMEDSNFYSTATYVIAMIFAFAWASLIPLSRYILGVHSADQIIYGSSIGIWNGFYLHFLLRDHWLRYIKRFRANKYSFDALDRKEKLRAFIISFTMFFVFITMSIVTWHFND